MQGFTFGKVRIRFQIERGVVVRNTSVGVAVWIRTKQGEERRLEYSFEDSQLRKGHEVSVIYAESSHNGRVCPVLLRNHHLSLSYALDSSDVLYKELVRPLTWS